MSERKPGHVPIEDFNLSVATVRALTEAFQGFLDDMNRSRFDMRVLSHETVEKMKVAGVKRKELYRLIDVRTATLRDPDSGKH